MARGNQAADQAAKRATLQNNDLIRVATLVPQTNLPETPSYTEGETLNGETIVCSVQFSRSVVSDSLQPMELLRGCLTGKWDRGDHLRYSRLEACSSEGSF